MTAHFPSSEPATPGTAPVPEGLLQDLLNELDAKSSLMPIFQAVAAKFGEVVRDFGFLLDDNLFDVGMSADGTARVFTSSATLREIGLGRHISVFWELRLSLEPERFGSSSLGITLCESGEPSDVRVSLGDAADVWWADMTAGWTPEHASSLAQHFQAQWSLRDVSAKQRQALNQLDEILAC